jgi:pilus assembly protein Flp/PilA
LKLLKILTENNNIYEILKILKGLRMLKVLQFVKDEDGPTALEYGVMLSFVLVAAVAAITLFGTTLSQLFGDINDGVQ